MLPIAVDWRLPIAVGWRGELSIQLLGGLDFNLDLMLNMYTGELDLLFGMGSAGGANAGISWSTGPVIAWNCPTNKAFEGVDLVYTGGNIPLGFNVEAEIATSIESGGPTTLYLGGSPLGFGGGQAGVQKGISFNIFRLRLVPRQGD